MVDRAAIVAVVVLFVPVTGTLMIIGGRVLLLSYLTRNSGTDSLHDVADGDRVELVGTARAIETRESVFGRECVGYRYRVDEWRHDDGSNWRVIDTDVVLAPFLLETSAGTVLVSSDEFTKRITGNQQRTVVDAGEQLPETFERPPSESSASSDRIQELEPGMPSADESRHSLLELLRLERLPQRSGNRYEAWGPNADNQRRYTEYALEEGEEVRVTGVAKPPEAASGDVPTEASAVLEPPESGGPTAFKRRLWPRRAMITDRPNRGFSKGTRYKAAFVAGVGAFILSTTLIALGAELLG